MNDFSDINKALFESDEEETFMPDLATYIGASISEKHFSRIVNFLKDNNIKNIPMGKDVSIPMLVSDIFEPVHMSEGIQYVVGNLELQEVETVTGSKKGLIVYGTCKELIDDVNELEEYIESENMVEYDDYVDFIICPDVGEITIDIDQLNVMFRKYVGETITFMAGITEHMTDEQLEAKLYGIGSHEVGSKR